MSNAAGRAHPHGTYTREFKQQVLPFAVKEPGVFGIMAPAKGA